MLLLQYLYFFAFASIASSNFGPCPGITTLRSPKFNVYWNVPTFMCHKYGLNFEEVKNFGIHLNTNDSFDGDKITILYNPGLFPALIIKNGNTIKINGGLPQEGDLSNHLKLFQEHLSMHISNESFSGIGVIDFESWRPIFRQNWGSLQPYRLLSISEESVRHPKWNNSAIKKEAKRRFEKFGRVFMEETLKTAKKLRPNASWGYYGYPFCFNETPGNPYVTCEAKTMKENDELSWLFSLEDAYMPSVYLRTEINQDERVGFVKSRVTEALRLAKKHGKNQTLPYYAIKYQNGNRDIFVTRKDAENTIQAIADAGANGLIIWGSSNDTNTAEKCDSMKQYLLHILGPKVKQIIDNLKESSFKDPRSQYYLVL